jgi:hypothetical protein
MKHLLTLLLIANHVDASIGAFGSGVVELSGSSVVGFSTKRVLLA